MRKSVGGLASWAGMICVVISAVVYGAMLFFEDDLASMLMAIEPPSPRQGRVFYYDMVRMARLDVLWLALFCLAFLMLVVYPSRTRLFSLFNISSDRIPYQLMLIALLTGAASLVVVNNVLEAFPNSSDEYAYLFQAELLSRGKLWVRAHDLPAFFAQNNIAQYEGIRVGRFPPGWPLMLSLAFAAGLDASFLNPILGIACLAVFVVLVRRWYGGEVAVWSGIAVGLSGFYVFNAASYFSHIAAMLAILLFVFCFYRHLESRSWLYALLAGFFLGLCAITRYYTALLVFLPFAIHLIHRLRTGALPSLVLIGAGAVPCMAFLLWYNYAITGNALLPVTMWAYPHEQLGFVRGHNALRGMEHIVRRVLMFFYWCSPGLFLLYFFFMWRKIRDRVERWSHPEDYVFLFLIGGYFFYYEIGGNQYGPRFWFEGFPFLAAFVVNGVVRARRKWLVAALLVSVIFAVARLPYIATREAKIIDQRQDVYSLVREEGVQHAVVLLASPTSPLRPMPVGDLTRNDPMFVNDVLYAVDVPDIRHQLMVYYPDRDFYLYTRDVNQEEGSLIRLR